MSQQQQQQQQQQNQQSNVPVSEEYWSLVAKADKKFSKIRDLPLYERNRYGTYFHKVFKVYTQLWMFQKENRHKLVEAGLKRWEIGDIASRIGQLYFGQYMRTSEASYLSESYIFYEAVLTREYFKDGVFQDLNLANKQLRFIARFLTVCLVLGRREMVFQLVNQLKMLIDECKRTFQETDFKEWKLVVQEIAKFLKADTPFMNIRPLRYSLALDQHQNSLPFTADTKRKIRLTDAILCSYHPNEVKFSELTLDTFRMLQCLEWEPSGSFYQSSGAPSSGAGNIGQNGAPGPSRVNYSQDITDPTLPPNPRKAVLYHPSITHFMAVLATACEELPPDGILLIYLSASGSNVHTMSSLSCTGTCICNSDIAKSCQSHTMDSDAAYTSPFCSPSDSPNPSSVHSKGDRLHYHIGGLHIGARGNGGLNCIYPCDLVPFTRRPLFLVIDSDKSKAFKAINGAEKGEPVAMLLSPTTSLLIHASVDSSRHLNGSLFTIFLTAPLQAFLLLLGFTGSDIEMAMYNKAEKILTSSLNHWGLTLAESGNLHPVWAQVLSDPFLKRILLRFIFCQAVISIYAPTFNKMEFIPECMPCLPEDVLPMSVISQTTVMQIANIFGVTNRFVFSEEIMISPSRHAIE